MGWRRPADPVAWLLGPGHLSLLDTEGRPLGEQSSPAYQAVHRDERVRAFGDVRDPTTLPFNHAALRQLAAHHRELLEALCAWFGSEPPTLERAYRRCHAATRLAPLAALREGRRPTPREAALFKVALGFHDLLATELLRARWDGDAGPPSLETVWNRIDEELWLVGERQVCAGTRKSITEVWEALAHGASGPLVAWPDLTASWCVEAVDASLELEALACAAGGAARPHLARHEPGEGAMARALLEADSLPRLNEILRRHPELGPLHPTLLYPSHAVPHGLATFVETIPRAALGDALRRIDAALDAAAAPTLLRLAHALDLPEPRPFTASLRAAH